MYLGLFCIPESLGLILYPLNQQNVVTPRQLCHRLWHNCRYGLSGTLLLYSWQGVLPVERSW